MAKSELPSATLVYGDAASGKTEYLVKKAAELSADGAVGGVCVVTNSPTASRAFSLRLEAFAPGAERRVRVVSARELCMDAVVRSGCARTRRVMGAEWAFVLADMKAAGIGGAAAKDSLGRVLSRWESGNFSYPGEEIDLRVQKFLRDKLDEYGLLAPQEISVLAAAAIRGGLYERYDAVLVDDAQNLGTWTRRACASLATCEVVFAFDPDGAVLGFDGNPTAFSEGELAGVCGATRVVRLSAFLLRAAEGSGGVPVDVRIKAFAHAVGHCDSFVYDELCESGVIGFDDESVVLLKWGTPEDESEGIAKVVRGLIGRGKAEPGEVYIAVPNRTWGLSLRRSLARHRMEATVALDDEPVRGNPVRSGAALLYLAYAKAALLADADDVMAWRIWCGAGKADLGVSAWRSLEERASEEGVSITAALRRLASLDTFPSDLGPLASRIREGLSFIETNEGLRGFSLSHVVFEGLPDDAFGIDGSMAGDEDALGLARLIRSAASFRTFDFDPNRVCVGTYRGIAGLSPRVVILTGVVDGFVPSRACFNGSCRPEENPTLQEERRAFVQAASKARGTLVISTFQRADRETAQRLGLVERRSRLDRGVSVSVLSRSCFIDDAENAAPSTQSADRLMG